MAKSHARLFSIDLIKHPTISKVRFVRLCPAPEGVAHCYKFQRLDECLLLCDRGTVDGAAYWPGEPHHFFDEIESTLERELARYDAVDLADFVDGTLLARRRVVLQAGPGDGK